MSQPSLLSPNHDPTLIASIDWIEASIFGEIATALCVIAVALIGFRMLTGRLQLALGMRSVLGVTLLLGAPAIAAAFVLGSETPASHRAPPAAVDAAPARELAPPKDDPNAGASLRRD